MKKDLQIELADTPSKQEQGLMFRKSLDEDSGMLFQFKRPNILGFWGQNTYIPLDIAFIDNQNKIVKIGKIEPLSEKIISSETPCVAAVEANEGWFERNGIKEGWLYKIVPTTIACKRDDFTIRFYQSSFNLIKGN